MKTLALLLACLIACAPMMEAKTVGTKITLATTSGSVTAGARGLIFIFDIDFTGTVAGVAYVGAVDASLQLPVQAGDTLDAVAYTVTAGSVRIVELR